MMTTRQSESAKQYVPDVGTYYVRVLGTRLNRFVEFEFAINDPEQLMVELIMPFQAFDELCKKYNAVLLSPRDDGDDNPGRPGLYHVQTADDGASGR